MAQHKRALAVETEDYSGDRSLDRLVDIGGLKLPAYPNHPLRRLARRDGRVSPEADRAQSESWRKSGGFGSEWAEFDEAYSRGWHPLAQVHPDDRPSLEVQRDFYGDLQLWLDEHLPFLTLEACECVPARRPAGKRLRVPGSGEIWTEESERG